MFTEKYILTLTDEEIINDSKFIARKFNIEIKHIFISRHSGLLVVVVKNVSEDIAIELEGALWRYTSGLTNINGDRINSEVPEYSSVSVEVYNNEDEYDELMDRCAEVISFDKLM